MKKNNYKNQNGRLLLEILAFLGMIMLITPMMLKKTVEKNIELEDSLIASQMKTLQVAADNFIANNYEDIINAKEIGGEAFETLGDSQILKLGLTNSELVDFLPDGFNNSNKLGGNYEIIIKKNTIGTDKSLSVSALIIGSPGTGEISDKRGARISSMIGSSGGFTKNSSTEAVGGAGLWKLDTNDYQSGGIGSGKIITSTVVMAAEIQSDSPATTGGNFLWRKSVDESQRRMGSDFSLGGFDIKWLKDIVSHEAYTNQSKLAEGSTPTAPTAEADGYAVTGDTDEGGTIKNYNLSLEGTSTLKDVALGSFGGNKLSDLLPPMSLKSITDVADGTKESVTAPSCAVGYAPVLMLAPNIGTSASTNAPIVKRNDSNGETIGWDVTFSDAGGKIYLYCKFVKESFNSL